MPVAPTSLLQHSFPHDYRSGPSPLDWYPSKWAIALLNSVGLASGLRRADVAEVTAARDHMLKKQKQVSHEEGTTSSVATDRAEDSGKWTGEIWTKEYLAEYAVAEGRCMLILGGYAVDATEYIDEHVR